MQMTVLVERRLGEINLRCCEQNWKWGLTVKVGWPDPVKHRNRKKCEMKVKKNRIIETPLSKSESALCRGHTVQYYCNFLRTVQNSTVQHRDCICILDGDED